MASDDGGRDTGSRAGDGRQPGADARDDARSRARLLGLLLVGVLGPGLARWWLGRLGYDRAGIVVFSLGYGAAVVLAWQYWLRGVGFDGPEG